jgi:hypothetical protein
MTKKQLVELWNSLDDDTEIEFPCASYKKDGKFKKIIIITDC